jgi:hypothetical protein
MTAYTIILIASAFSAVWLSIALVQELRRKQEALDLCMQKLMAWEDELSSVMPKDFTDWWQTDRSEWPMVTTSLIRMLKADNDRAWKMAAENK